MATDKELAALDLKQYVVNTLNALQWEVDKQFDKWSKPHLGYLDLLLKAHEDAVSDQYATLKEYEEDEKRSFERAMFVLNLLAIPATAWLGAALSQKVGPGIFYTYKPASNVILPANWLPKVVNQIDVKVFGDMGKDLAKLLLKITGDQYQSTPYKEPNAKKAAYSPNADRFGQAILEEIEGQRQTIHDTISKISQQVARSTSAGMAIVGLALNQNPNIASRGSAAISTAGYQIIDSIFDSARKIWADQWYYYGNDPPTPDWYRVKLSFGREMWALWIIQQRFSVAVSDQGLFWINGASGNVLGTTGGFASAVKDSPITTRLFEDFNAPVMDIIQHGPPSDKDGCQTQVDKINNWANGQTHDVLRKLLQGAKRPLKSIRQMWE